MKISILKSLVILAVSVISFYPTGAQAQSESSSKTKNKKAMQSFISIFEIPATDLNRAADFYQSILDIKIEVIDMQGMQMGLFPSEGYAVSGVITKGEGYEPAASGVLVYLNGGNNLEGILNKVEKSGGEVLMPKTPIDEENGYFALFLDTEGNRIGVHSPN